MATILIEGNPPRPNPKGLGFVDPATIIGGVGAVGGIVSSIFGKKDSGAKDQAKAIAYAANVESYTGRVQSLQAAELAQQKTEMWLWIAGFAGVAIVATGVVIAKRRKK